MLSRWSCFAQTAWGVPGYKKLPVIGVKSEMRVDIWGGFLYRTGLNAVRQLSICR